MKRLLLLPLLAVSLCAQSGGQFVSVIKTIPTSAWQLGAGSSIIQLPDGTSALNLGYGSSASVDLGMTPAQLQADPNHPGSPGYAIDGKYQITLLIDNGLNVYPGWYDIEISFGTQQLCEWYGYGVMGFQQATHTCFSPRYLIADQALPGGGPVQSQNDLVLTATVPGGWQLYFKDGSLIFTPTN